MTRYKFVNNEWVFDGYGRGPTVKENEKKDPTLSQYINEHGGIKSPVDNKIYHSESSYKNHLKNTGHHIHE